MDAEARQLTTALWGKSVGYVFICSIDWLHGRRFNPGKSFKWPAQRHELSDYVDSLVKAECDVYFTPAMFDKPQRKAEHVIPRPLMWADVDEAPIDEVRRTKPLALWETSPGRYQAAWWLTGAELLPRDMPSLPRLASHVLHCDPSGWDDTQLLRLPGTVSHKRDVPHQVGNLELGTRQPVARFLGRLYTAYPFATPRVRAQLRAEQVSGDRSRVLFNLTQHLLSKGVAVEDTAALLRWSVWNKWPSPDQLLTDVRRIASRMPPEPTEAVSVLEDAEPPAERARLTVQTLADTAVQQRPKWLVRGLVEQKSCGFIAGPPKQFKSWVMLDMAISVALGKSVLGAFSTKQRPVLLVEAEDSFARLSQRLSIITASRYPSANPHGRIVYHNRVLTWLPPRSDVPLFIVSQPPMGFSEDFYTDLIELIQEYGIKLCLYDTLSMLTAQSLNDSQAMYADVLRPLKAIANEYDAAQLIVHHTRKATLGLAASGGAALAGSVALHAWSDNSLYMQRCDGGKILMEVETKAQSAQTYELSHLNTPRVWLPQVAVHDMDETEQVVRLD